MELADVERKFGDAAEGSDLKAYYFRRMELAQKGVESAQKMVDYYTDKIVSRHGEMSVKDDVIGKMQNHFSQKGWHPREPAPRWKRQKLFSREDIIGSFATYVSAAKSPLDCPQREQVLSSSGKGFEICTTVGTMGMGKTVC